MADRKLKLHLHYTTAQARDTSRSHSLLDKVRAVVLDLAAFMGRAKRDN